MTVDVDHEYFADGVLVSNCDCAQYCASFAPRYVRPRPLRRLQGWTTKYIEAKKRRRAKESGWGSAVRLG